MVYTKKNNMNVIISAKTYKIECINETIEKTIKNNKIYVLLLEYIKFIIFESFLKLSGIARYNIIPFVIATKSRNPIIPLAHISKPTSLTSLLTDTKRRKVGHNKTHKNTYPPGFMTCNNGGILTPSTESTSFSFCVSIFIS